MKIYILLLQERTSSGRNAADAADVKGCNRKVKLFLRTILRPRETSPRRSRAHSVRLTFILCFVKL